MISNEQLKALLADVEPEVRVFRRWFHENPELSGKEERTSSKIVEIIESCGLPWERVGDYGIIARIEGGFERKTVMLRADMDALPVKESETNLKNIKVCISKTEGVSHACGHDAHMAMMLGAIMVLNRLKAQLHGRVLVVFEQAEELGQGVMAMLEALKQYPVDTCYATHVYAGLETGKLCVQPGERMASMTAFSVRVKGKGGHASRPDLTVNPLMCIANILVNLNSIWTGEVDPTKTVTLGIGMINGGNKGNVIPDEGIFSGTMRYFDVEEGKKAFEAVKRVCELVAEAHHCTVTYDKILQSDCTVMNDEGCSERAAKSIRNLLGDDVLSVCEPWFATESMGMYLMDYPGVLAFLGIRDEENGYGAGHHTKEFDLDEAVLIRGCGAAVAYAVDTLEHEERK